MKNLLPLSMICILVMCLSGADSFAQETTKPSDQVQKSASESLVDPICASTDPSDRLEKLKKFRKRLNSNDMSIKPVISKDQDVRLTTRLRELIEGPKVLSLEFPKTWDQVKGNNSFEMAVEIRDESIMILEKLYPATYEDVVNKIHSGNNVSVVMASIVGNAESIHTKRKEGKAAFSIVINDLDKDSGFIVYENLMKSDNDLVRVQVISSFSQYVAQHPEVGSDDKFRSLAFNVFQSDKFDNVKIILLRVLVNWTRDDKEVLAFLKKQAVSETQ